MADDNTEASAPKSGGGLMSSLPLALIAGAATFGMVWMAASPSGDDSAVCETSAHAEEVDIEELSLRAANYVTLEPITVSLGPDAGAKHLKVTISLATPEDAHGLTDVQFLRLRDRFLERLRTIDTAIITDPNGMADLKEILLTQAQATLGDDQVFGVLITEFLMK